MPFVIPFPLLNMARELGDVNDRLADLEAHRFGAQVATLSSLSIPNGSAQLLTSPAVTCAIPASGSAFMTCGLIMPVSAGGILINLGIAANGTMINETIQVITSQSSQIPASFWWSQGNLPMGPVQFQMYLNVSGGPMAATNLFIAVIPT